MKLPRSAAARWAAWLVSLGLLCAAAAWRLAPHPINTDILAMLPAEQGPEALTAATDRSRDAFVRQVLVLIGGPDDTATRTAAESALKSLNSAGLKTDVSGASVNGVLALYKEHHFALLDAGQAARLVSGGAPAYAKDVAVNLASPAGLMSSFATDPAGYLTAYLSSLPRPYGDFLPDGAFFSALRDDKRYYLLSLESPDTGFSTDDMQVTRAIGAARGAAAQACPACSLQATGAPLFADRARSEAQAETIWLSAASMLLIMVLIAYVFRSLAPHVLAALQLVASVLAACAAVIVCFGSIQILTLVFGTTLLGIAIDYALLYFAEYWFGDGDPAKVMRTVGPGLYMGLLTGVAAFAFLLFAGFPALLQIAVFSIAGLLEAALVVVLIFPVTLTARPAVAEHPAVRWPQAFIAAACRPSRWRMLLPVAVLLMSLPGWCMLTESDDVRDLQQLPPELVQTDTAIRTTLGQVPPPGFFLVEGKDLDEALSREEVLFARLDARLPDTTTLGLSRFLPSQAQQAVSLAAWNQVFARPVELRKALAGLGLPPELADRMHAGWQSAGHAPLSADEMFKAAPDLRRFVIPESGRIALLSTVMGKAELDPGVLKDAASGVPGTLFEAPLARIAATFHRIRVRTTWLVVIGYLLIAGLLVWRYGRRETLRMLYTPLLALGVTLGVLGWLGDPVNIFVVVALILILGLGRDYTVFLREGGARRRSPALAVTLSALTMLCSFGLLALSQVPALHVFGLATLAGILASYLSAPLSLPPET